MRTNFQPGTLATATGFERYAKKTRRAEFLEKMERVVPWAELVALVEPHYPKAGNGRRPVGVERMLRMYFLQQWFNLSDPAVEEALYDSPLMREFVGIDLGREAVPDETTMCKFRHRLEEHQIGAAMLATVNEQLQEKGVRIATGTIVDATIIQAPSSMTMRFTAVFEKVPEGYIGFVKGLPGATRRGRHSKRCVPTSKKPSK